MAHTTDTDPAISVVVATRNRAQLVPRLIEALEGEANSPPFEVIFVDDGSTDDTPAVLAALCAGATVAARTIRLDHNRGPAAARNAGWQAAASPLIAFTDDDCVPQPGWLSALVDGLRDADIAQGRTTANPTQPPSGWFSWAPETHEENGFYETCNIGYRRATLAAVGGFDRAFGPGRRRRPDEYVAPAWGEDTDLAMRAKAAGGRSVFVPDAVVWHDVKPGRLRDRLADLSRREGIVLAVKRHPALRQRFESPWFVQRAHALLVATALGALLVARRPSDPKRWAVAVAAGGAWARSRGSYYPAKTWLRVLPQWLVADGAEVAVLAAASVRYRTLLL